MSEAPAAPAPCIPRVAPGSGAETRAVRTGIAIDGPYGAVIPPIYLSSTYAFAGFKGKRAYDYTRTANPTSSLSEAPCSRPSRTRMSWPRMRSNRKSAWLTWKSCARASAASAIRR